ncbi:hypothetical protein L227DRAFT_555742 [Lentinus tigrinus ALCF2SS1-6]|uniref:Uncharacterized protein n=1 Tax=Lentinus tigrinus ALCF2SS1-6 TaxID=1328759 RepID=A0A5C2RVY3_9APHY|nr:hypothetical protein L227DRAFT_555742 [Lentinus tigrinus ALCF2SS1-6]
MPAKYSHVKKRQSPKKQAKRDQNPHQHKHHEHDHDHGHAHTHAYPGPQVDRCVAHATAMAKLERTISRILLIRFEQDIARLFSTHLYYVALQHLPTFVIRCITVGGPSWVAANTECDEIKDFLRGALSMDMRQAGDRVATKSVLWTYTALRHFAKSQGISICERGGLHSVQLLPHHAALVAHLASLKAHHPPPFSKPPHLGPMTAGIREIIVACKTKYGKGTDWQEKVREGYDRLCELLYRIASEFDVRGYGLLLREKLTEKWCDCGCSTDHLSEVCERTVRMEEEESGVRSGKEREWDGRGTGVSGWETEDEEDLWHVDFEMPGETKHDLPDEMSVGELMELRYMQAEREKEQGNVAFKKGNFLTAIERYKAAYRIEPELPHYQLNLAAAYLKLNDFIEAEKACDLALGQHRSMKGYWRRAQARKGQGRIDDAIADLHGVLRLQHTNKEAFDELCALDPKSTEPSTAVPSSSTSIPSSSSSRPQPSSSSSSSSSAHRLSSKSRYEPLAPRVKPLPFERSPTDDRKLKISSIPVTVDIPVEFLNVPTTGPDKGKGAPGEGQASGRMVSQTFAYPCWERYMVQRVAEQ